MEIKPGERLTSDPRKGTTIVVDSDEIVVIAFRYAPGEEGPDVHIHDHHADSFYVVEGELTVRLGEETLTAPAGTWITAPPGVAHTFSNRSDREVSFLNVHAPGMRFAEYLRGLRAGRPDIDFDQREPPPDGGRPASDGFAVQAV